MGRRDGNNRKDRYSRKVISKKLGYYIIITDTKETEKNYFDGFRKNLNEVDKNKISLKIIPKVRYDKLIERALSVRNESSQNSEVWIVIDKDENKDFDEFVNNASNNSIQVGWSNPCIETWFLLYFENQNSSNSNQKSCINNFKRIYKKHTQKEYVKNESRLYDYLTQYGNEKKAIQRANKIYKSRLPCDNVSDMAGTTNLHNLIDEINSILKIDSH